MEKQFGDRIGGSRRGLGIECKHECGEREGHGVRERGERGCGVGALGCRGREARFPYAPREVGGQWG